MNKRLIRQAEKEKRDRRCAQCANAAPITIIGTVVGHACQVMGREDCGDGTFARKCRFWEEKK